MGRLARQHPASSLRPANCLCRPDNYWRPWSDPQFLNALWVTVRFVASPAIETVLGLALVLFCLREFTGIRLLRTVLIIPMVITPVVVAIVFRLIYSSDVGMITTLLMALGGGHVEILGDPTKAFIGLVALDVWEWTPLMFLILLAGLQSLPQEPFEAARVDGAGPWRIVLDLTLPMLRPVLAIAIVLRAIDAFGTLTSLRAHPRRPGEATKLVHLRLRHVLRSRETGYAAAMFVAIGLIVLAFALFACASSSGSNRHEAPSSHGPSRPSRSSGSCSCRSMMVSTSLKSNKEITQETTFYPHAPTFANYLRLFSRRKSALPIPTRSR
jgi:multiple sugar transport system permease protein